MTRILIADGDAVFRRALAEQLRLENGYEVVESDGAPVEGTVDLVLLDANLPDGLLAAQGDPPAILLGGPGGLAKPVRLAEVLARVRAALRAQDQGGEEVALGPIRFLPAARLLVKDGEKIRLTDKEAAILRHLHRKGATAREALLTEIWGYNAGIDTHTLETHIYRLRQKLGDAEARLLVTTDSGYRLVL